jgi:hypothetical protein
MPNEGMSVARRANIRRRFLILFNPYLLVFFFMNNPPFFPGKKEHAYPECRNKKTPILFKEKGRYYPFS